MARKIAYMMSRFPKVTETFILYEMLELQKLGLQIEVFPLLRQRETTAHPEVQQIADHVHYHRILSLGVLMAQLYWLWKRPLAYLRTWWDVLRGNAESVKFLSRAVSVMPLAALFAREMQTLGIEHIHAHWATHPTLGAFIINRLTGIPYSFTAHAHDIYVERAMLDDKLEAAAFSVTISEYNRSFLRELYGERVAERVEIVHCGIDTDVFQPRQPREADGLFRIVCVASLEEKKGHPYLIDACAQFKAHGVDFRCTLIGEGEDRPKIEEQIDRLGLSEQVILTGRQPRQRVRELLAEADVMVLPSIVTNKGKKEGIPVALMEALATELPVIATKISGIPELIVDGETGMLVPERDAISMADALIQLQEHPELGTQLGKQGRQKVLDEFSLTQNAQQLYDLFTGQTHVPGTRTTRPALATE